MSSVPQASSSPARPTTTGTAIHLSLSKPDEQGDGKTPETAYWSSMLWKNLDQPHYLAYRFNEKPPAKWIRCARAEARYEAEAGYAVYEIGATKTRRVNLLAQEPPQQWALAFDNQLHEIVEVERAQEKEEIDSGSSGMNSMQ